MGVDRWLRQTSETSKYKVIRFNYPITIAPFPEPFLQIANMIESLLLSHQFRKIPHDLRISAHRDIRRKIAFLPGAKHQPVCFKRRRICKRD